MSGIMVKAVKVFPYLDDVYHKRHSTAIYFATVCQVTRDIKVFIQARFSHTQLNLRYTRAVESNICCDRASFQRVSIYLQDLVLEQYTL